MLRRAVTAFVRRLALGEQVRHADAELLAELQQLVVGQGEPVVLDFRQGRDRNPAAFAHLLERPAAVIAQSSRRIPPRVGWPLIRASDPANLTILQSGSLCPHQANKRMIRPDCPIGQIATGLGRAENEESGGIDRCDSSGSSCLSDRDRADNADLTPVPRRSRRRIARLRRSPQLRKARRS